jgi:hypothetical protein
MKKTYTVPITFILVVEGDDLPTDMPPRALRSVLDNLNISDETNDMFMDSIQDNFSGDVKSFRFK